MLKPGRLTTHIELGDGYIRGKHYLRTQSIEGRGWLRVNGGVAESAVFQDSELHQSMSFEWTAAENAGWPLLVFELWRVGKIREDATLAAVGALHLPLLHGHTETRLPLFTSANSDQPPCAESLLFPTMNSDMALRCVCVLAVSVHNFTEDFDLQGVSLHPRALAYK